MGWGRGGGGGGRKVEEVDGRVGRGKIDKGHARW